MMVSQPFITQNFKENFIAWCCAGLIGLLFFDLLYVLAGGFLNADSAWILETGHYILGHSEISPEAPFTWMQDERLIAYQWLLEAFSALLDQIIGRGLMLKVMIVVAVLPFSLIPAYFAKRERTPLISSLIVIGGVFLISLSFHHLRPNIITNLFLSLQYLLLFYWHKGRVSWRLLLGILLPIYLLWGNMHTGVILGLAMILMFGLGDYLEGRGIYRRADLGKSLAQPVRRYLILLILAFLFSCLNPYGWGIYAHLLEIASQTEMNAYIRELSGQNYWALVFVLPFLLLIPFPSLRQVISLSDILLILFASLMTFGCLRCLLWLLLFIALILPRILERVYVLAGWQSTSKHYFKVCLSLCLGVMLFLALPLGDYARFGKCYKFKEISQKVQSLDSGRLMNDARLGSCLILHGYERVGFDTRFDYYRQEYVLEVSNALRQPEEHLGQYLEKYNIQYIAIEKGRWDLEEYLQNHSEYQELYQDKFTVLYKVTP